MAKILSEICHCLLRSSNQIKFDILGGYLESLGSHTKLCAMIANMYNIINDQLKCIDNSVKAEKECNRDVFRKKDVNICSFLLKVFRIAINS